MLRAPRDKEPASRMASRREIFPGPTLECSAKSILNRTTGAAMEFLLTTSYEGESDFARYDGVMLYTVGYNEFWGKRCGLSGGAPLRRLLPLSLSITRRTPMSFQRKPARPSRSSSTPP